ncbi:PREDICTED: uncharacterized protein At4g26485-like [Tarenaya hassleriana]|uniref:uncharacterized protein At4g26485-like n=1 Tax=Tarenaya hassleriana TaxID=28532 RepID=UPI00053CA8AD|nr:PREDICTED: uncharacterized protein At4g26485-like [Tarenaya hassleriana]XP_010539348.1 PREDICTED: uncharacterized protein At4g26485-like [Tarenaya hassleriana]
MEDGTERWLNHYSSKQQILLVGEGNFSFSLSLARAFGSAANMTATSLDTHEELRKKYGTEAVANVEALKALGCTIMHGVDVHAMSQHIDLRSKRYDRIVFNFPHAGANVICRALEGFMITDNQVLVRGFLKNAGEMVKEDGEIHVTHKTTHPYNMWGVETLGREVNLCLVKEVPFFVSYYPGYVNMRGCTMNSDSTFHVGNASTFMFRKV